MAEYRKKTSTSQQSFRPATSPDAREQQLISLAVDLAEKQLREGTASSQVITQLLKLSTSQHRLEKERLTNENALLKAKVEQLESGQRTEEMYSNALKAMRRYSGQEEPEDDVY